MTIQDWGAIGEILGATAVFLTLIFLSVQITQTKRLIRAQLRADRAGQAANAMITVADSNHLLAAIAETNGPGPTRQIADELGIDYEKALRIGFYLGGLARSNEQRAKDLPDDRDSLASSYARQLATSPLMIRLWQQTKASCDSAYVNAVDEHLARVSPSC